MSDVKIDDHSDEYLKEVADSVEVALEAIGIHLAGEAQEELENSPRRIDTGLLRNSITYALDGKSAGMSSYKADRENAKGVIEKGSYSGTAPKEKGKDRSVIVGTNVEYGIYVHEGTSRMSPNRFLKNALDRNKDQIKEYIKKAMG